MSAPAKIRKLDEVVVNRIAAGEVIQRPANALKELIENSLDAKATNIQVTTIDGGLKLLQIQDNGTGIRKDDLEIVCERFTTSKLQSFEDLKTISTYGFRGEALASMSHIAHLTITTKTADEKCAYKASYIDSKLKAPPKACAGNQGTIITIENLFYNVPTRKKALSNPTEEFAKITDVVMKYAIHNPGVGFTLKKHKETSPQVRTPHNSTKINNVKLIYGNTVARELLEVDLVDEKYKFNMHALITTPNYSSKRMVFLLFINNRLVESSLIKRMLEDLYTIYLPKKTHPWCYISLDINPNNVDVNVHPTKHEVRFLHEDSVVERIKVALDEKLSSNGASRTFYLQARLPKADITKDVLKEVLPEYDKDSTNKSKKIHAREMIRTDASDQKLDRFNFTVKAAKDRVGSNINESLDKSVEMCFEHTPENNVETTDTTMIDVNKTDCVDTIDLSELQSTSKTISRIEEMDVESTSKVKTTINEVTKEINTEEVSAAHNSERNDSVSFAESETTPVPSVTKPTTPVEINEPCNTETTICTENDILDFINPEFYEDSMDETIAEKCRDTIAEKARENVYKYFGSQEINDNKKIDTLNENQIKVEEKKDDQVNQNEKNITKKTLENTPTKNESKVSPKDGDESATNEFKSYSINTFRREVKLTSVLLLRKEIEDNADKGLKEILSHLTFVGCIDKTSALVQSGVNLYICDTRKLAEELFYEIMLYDFGNFGAIKFSDPISLYDLALLALNSEEAEWTEEDGQKEDLAQILKDLFIQKADMVKEYFSIVIDRKGNLKSLPVLLDKYFPHEAGLPLYILRLATEVDWSTEQTCFQNICRETAKYYSQMNSMHQTYDWKYITEHILYPAIKESLLPPKHFAHDSTILQIANLPDLYKVFERC